ncbi:MAG: shikimate kinase [bacterium]|nr:shikimate kinase [bacterium]
MEKPNNIILTGFMGTGKTTIGKLLAVKLNWSYIDTDAVIEERLQMSITTIFAKFGEPYFRDVESAVIREIMQKNQQVIATGGGIVLREQNVTVMKSNGIILWLTAPAEVIYKRIQSDTTRPLLQVADPLQRIKELLHERIPYYAKADLVIDTSTKAPEELVELIHSSLMLKEK